MIKEDLKEMGWEGMDRNYVSQNRAQWGDFVTPVIYLRDSGRTLLYGVKGGGGSLDG
jgi:hypothetical protein